MKYILSTIALLATCSLNAQTPATANARPQENDKLTSAGQASAAGDFSRTTIVLKGRKLIFNDLPQLSKATIVTVINKEGEAVLQGKVTPADNAIDMRYLDKGTYFINLLYKKERKKGFVVNL